ncbi:hypothetical protein SGRIM119S_03421 [Streptomyces griseorubiginosus]
MDDDQLAERVLRWIRGLREAFGVDTADDETLFLDRLRGLAALEEMRAVDGYPEPLTWATLDRLVLDYFFGHDLPMPAFPEALDQVLTQARAHASTGAAVGLADFSGFSGLEAAESGESRTSVQEATHVAPGVFSGDPGAEGVEAAEERARELQAFALERGMAEEDAAEWGERLSPVIGSADQAAILAANLEFGEAVAALRGETVPDGAAVVLSRGFRRIGGRSAGTAGGVRLRAVAVDPAAVERHVHVRRTGRRARKGAGTVAECAEQRGP